VTLSALELEKIFGELLDRVDILRGRTEISELSGGLTNRNLKVSTPSGTYVARVSSNDSQLLEIDRQSEFENSKLAAEVAIAAPVYDYVPGGGLLVIGYLPGKTFDSSDVKNNLPRIAESCRTLHSARPFLREFNMFSVQKNYLKIVNDRGFRKPDKYDDYQKYADILSKAFAATNTGLVPCNNDLLPANFIDDGSKIWIIDYEYSGNNDPCFELGNIWAEAYLEIDALHELVTAYYGEERPDKFARAWLYSVFAKYGWTLWGAIQDSMSDLEFDFWEWAMRKYEGAQSDFGSKFFNEQLTNL
jgi:thiamine kinase-like enzyme